MIKKASELRAAALSSLSGKWGAVIIMMVVYMIVVGLVSCIPMVGGLVSLLLLPMGWSVSVAFLDNVRGKGDFAVNRLLDGFNSDYTRLFYTLLLQAVYTILWTLLLIVPGVIKQYSYAMTPYILKDEPELKGNAAIEKSMAMMEGHKFDLFYLQLTFIGWAILAALTCGLGYLWLAPYMQSATACFYEEVKADYETRKGASVA